MTSSAPAFRTRVAFIGRRRGDHASSSQLDHLHEQMTHAARGGVDEHGVSFLDRIRRRAEIVRRHSLERGRDGELIGDAVRHRNRLLGLDEHLLGIASRRGDPRHVVACSGAGDTFAERGHDACALDSGDQRRRASVAALALVDVSVVHADHTHVHEQLSGPRLWRGVLLELQHLGPAVAIDRDCAHAAQPL